ncbi:MAG: hypothetical protein ACUVXD_00730 [Thermodesulfobacteriota bacterium]
MRHGHHSDQEISVCLPCEVAGEGSLACVKARDYVSEEEEEILRDLRALKEQARSLRGRIKGMRFADPTGCADEGDSGSLAQGLEAAIAEMEELRRAWADLEARLKRANARKLALLGHGPGEVNGSL